MDYKKQTNKQKHLCFFSTAVVLDGDKLLLDQSLNNWKHPQKA